MFRLQGGVSFDSAVISGVPQGAVLGALLFIILMCDITSGIISSSMVSFADDTRLYYGICNIDDYAILQNDLNSVFEWASDNNMLFNAQKFQYLCLTLILHYLVMFTPFPVYTKFSSLDMYLTLVYMCQVIEYHITNLNKRTTHLTGWILRTFSSRDKLTLSFMFGQF